MASHKWKPVSFTHPVYLKQVWQWQCVYCKSIIHGHPEMGPGELENRRITQGILENCREEQIKRVMET